MLHSLRYVTVANGPDSKILDMEHAPEAMPGLSIIGEGVEAPAIEGGFVLTTRGGDFELDIGQDISIGYLSHSSTTVDLYFQETFTFRLLTTEASVVLTP